MGTGPLGLEGALLLGGGVGPGPGADFLGHVDALLGGVELGHKLGDVGTGPLGLEGALLLGGVLDDGLGLLLADLGALLEATAGGGAQLAGLLGAPGNGGVLLDALLPHVADLAGPLGALGLGGVAGGLVLALLVLDGLALDHVVLHVVLLLLGPALGLVLGPADLGAADVTVLNEGSPADLDGLVEGNLLVVDEAVLPEVLLALLFLLGLVVGHVGGVAPPVVGMVTLNRLVVLSLLDHLDLVDTLLAVPAGAGGSHLAEGDGSVVAAAVALERIGGGELDAGPPGRDAVVLGVEGEGGEEGPLVAGLLAHSAAHNGEQIQESLHYGLQELFTRA